MSTLSLRLPESLHALARAVAKEEDISLNQLITLALAEKLSALKTGEYFERRAQGSSRAKFERALSQVKKRAPKEPDRLPRHIDPSL
jgi:HicB family